MGPAGWRVRARLVWLGLGRDPEACVCLSGGNGERGGPGVFVREAVVGGAYIALFPLQRGRRDFIIAFFRGF